MDKIEANDFKRKRAMFLMMNEERTIKEKKKKRIKRKRLLRTIMDAKCLMYYQIEI